MRSSSAQGKRSFRLSDQRGLGLVEVLVASGILGVSMAVMLTNMSTMVIGARVADRRTAEERVVRNQIETLMAAAPTCSPKPAPASVKIDNITYTVGIQVTAVDATGKVVPCSATAHYLEYKVTATDPAGANGRVALSAGMYQP